MIADRVNPNDFYYYAGSRVYFSNNSGVSFTLQTSNAPSGGKLAVNPFVSGDLWIAASGGIYNSTNFGAAFSQVPSNLTSTNRVLALGAPAPGQTKPAIYVFGTVNNFLGIYRSDDGGSTWTVINDVNHQWGGLIQSMAADPNVFGRVYLAVNGRGVIMGNPANVLPANWIDADIGTPGNPGWANNSVTLSNGAVINQWTVNGGGAGLTGAAFSVSSLSSSTKADGQRIATVVTTAANGLHVGDQVTISGATPLAYNGTFAVSSIVNATSFNYVVTPGLAAASGTITAATHDQFNFVYTSVPGDQSIVAQLTSLNNAGTGSPQAGVMFRAGSNAGDVFVAVVQNTGGQLIFEYRTTSGGLINSTSLGNVPVGAEYVRLLRSGVNLSGYYSTDGVNWTQLGSTIAVASMPTTSLIGLAVTANYNPQLSSANFAKVAVVASSTFLKGDINIDGYRDAGDIVPLLQALTDLSTYQSSHNLSPTDLITIADVNNDGKFNNADLQALLEILISDAGNGSGGIEAKTTATGGNSLVNQADETTVTFDGSTPDGGERRGTLFDDGTAEISRKRSRRTKVAELMLESSRAVVAVSHKKVAMPVLVSSAVECPFVAVSHGASANVQGVRVDVSEKADPSSGFSSTTTAGDCAVDYLFERYDPWDAPSIRRRHGLFDDTTPAQDNGVLR